MKKWFILILAPVFLSINACEEEEKSFDKALLDGTSWMLEAKKADPGVKIYADSDPITDLYAEMSACEKDDIYRFNADGTFEITEGELECGTGYTDGLRSGDWSLTDNNTKIKFIGQSGMTQTWNINALNKEELKITYKSAEASQEQTITETYGKL